MPSGSVIEYRGKRGTVWRVKYRDADGKQVMETTDATTKREAKKELRRRLARVDGGYVKPAPLSFGAYAERWFSEGPAKRRWKPRTIQQYRAVRRRLVAHFGSMPLAAIRRRGTSPSTSRARSWGPRRSGSTSRSCMRS
jgi:Phage integrase, N-terminal SAM-like domain